MTAGITWEEPLKSGTDHLYAPSCAFCRQQQV
jgi:hypothetical protein